ncbi:hypothetical protein [Micromonospora chersina]|uniref:hypothetical protein n=1 Tax=Micromonospora chersina TaxID=47854 RepID=UPI003699F68F
MTAGVTATLVRPTGPSPTPAPVSGGRAAGAGRHLADPDPDRLATLGGRLSAAYPGRVAAGTRLADADLAVNATPLGLRPGDPPPLAVADLPAHAVVADVIMFPAETALLRAARERGLPAHPGEPVPAHQIDAHLHFFGL